MLGVIGALIFVVEAESLKSSRSGQSLCAAGSLTLLVADFDFWRFPVGASIDAMAGAYAAGSSTLLVAESNFGRFPAGAPTDAMAGAFDDVIVDFVQLVLLSVRIHCRSLSLRRLQCEL